MRKEKTKLRESVTTALLMLLSCWCSWWRGDTGACVLGRGGEGKKDSGADDSGGTKAATIGPQPSCLFPAKPQRCSHFPQPPPAHTHTRLLGTKPHSHDQRQLQTHTLRRHKAAKCFHTAATRRRRRQPVYRSMKAAALSGDGGGRGA